MANIVQVREKVEVIVTSCSRGWIETLHRKSPTTTPVRESTVYSCTGQEVKNMTMIVVLVERKGTPPSVAAIVSVVFLFCRSCCASNKLYEIPTSNTESGSMAVTWAMVVINELRKGLSTKTV